jgi:hypothetical protein
MKTQVTFAAVAALALAAAAPASAALTTFASMGNADLQWSQSTGKLTQIDTAGDSYAAVNFEYDTTGLASLGTLAAGLVFSDTSTGNSVEQSSLFGEQVGQALGTGTFTVYYEGPTITDHDITLTKGVTVLLTGTVGGGAIGGVNNQSGADVDIDTGGTGLDLGTVTYSSPLLDFGSPVQEVLSLTASSTNVALKYTAGKKLNSFHAIFGGNFSTDPGPTAPGIPEPASWALMLLGIGAVGGALRRRTGSLTA